MVAPKRNSDKPAASKAAASKSARAEKDKDEAARILIVEARYYDDLADTLLAGAQRALETAGATFDVVTVPGALEIPSAIAIAVDAADKKKKPYDGAVALGCVIQGETFHFDIVAMQSARAIMDMTVQRKLPIGNGILTVDTEAQAWERAKLDKGDKGGDAARAALAVAAIKRQAEAK